VLDDDQGSFRSVECGHRDLVFLRQFVGRIKKCDIGMRALQHGHRFAGENFGAAFESQRCEVFANHFNRPAILLDKDCAVRAPAQCFDANSARARVNIHEDAIGDAGSKHIEQRLA